MTFDRLQKLSKLRQAIVNSRMSEAREQARQVKKEHEMHTDNLVLVQKEMDQSIKTRIEQIVEEPTSILALSLLTLEYKKNEDWMAEEQEKNTQLEHDRQDAEERLEVLSAEFKLQLIKEKKMKFATEKLSSYLRPTEPTEG